tara:strand:+ start:331 stop:699 length:369 start_codon:yes stop_codon:yes gene_type:complete
MKPTQEQILSALNKLVRENKTKLKSEKVELGAIDDLEKGIKKAISFSTKAITTLQAAGDKSDSLADKFMKEARSMQKLKSNIEKQAKDLGLDLPKNIKNLMNDLDANFEAIIKTRKIIGSLS